MVSKKRKRKVKSVVTPEMAEEAKGSSKDPICIY